MTYFTVSTRQLAGGLCALPSLFVHQRWNTGDNLFVEVWAPEHADRLVFSAHNRVVTLSASLPLARPEGNAWEARAVITMADMADAYNHVADWALADRDDQVRIGIFGDTVTFDVDHGQSVTLLGVPDHFPTLGTSLTACGPGVGTAVEVHRGVPQTKDHTLNCLSTDQRVSSAMAVLACAAAGLEDVMLWPRVENEGCSHGWFSSYSPDGHLSVYGAI